MQSVQYRVKNFLQLRDQALLAAESDTIAIRRYQVAENRYRIGKIDLNHLFTAQQDRSSARVGYIRALRDYWTGWYNLRKLTLYNFQQDEPIKYTLY
jgi:outer membrane protein TolC